MNRIAVDTFLSYKFVSNPVVSPKGDYVAYFVKDTNIVLLTQLHSYKLSFIIIS